MIKLPSIKTIIESFTHEETDQIYLKIHQAEMEGHGDDGTVDCLSCLLMDLDFIPYAYADIAYSLVHGKYHQ